MTEPAPPQPALGPFDLLVLGGTVVDPATRVGRFDVAIAGGVVAKVAPDLSAAPAARRIDATGAIVTPGLVDLHTHVFSGSTYWGIDPAPFAWRTGVTTWVDAGSAGASTIERFEEVVAEAAEVSVKAFLNIAGAGLAAETGEGRHLTDCDPEACASAIVARRDLLVGVKCRLDRSAVDDGPQVLRRALAAAGDAGVPLMVHIGAGPPDIDVVLDALRPGDLVTYATTGQTMALVDESGSLRRSAVAALGRGVLLDLGHGSGGFCFPVAEALGRAGRWPQVISSDLHQKSVLGPGFDLPTCLAKMLALGMPFDEVVRAATSTPARAVGLPSGTLQEGAAADLAVFEVREGRWPLFDTHLAERVATRLLVNTVTVRAGRELMTGPAHVAAPWIALSSAQRRLLRALPPTEREPWATRLSSPGCFVPLLLEGPVIRDGG